MAQAYGGTGTKSFGQQQLRLGRSESLADFARNLQSQTTGNLRRATESKMMGLTSSALGFLPGFAQASMYGMLSSPFARGTSSPVSRVQSSGSPGQNTLWMSNLERLFKEPLPVKIISDPLAFIEAKREIAPKIIEGTSKRVDSEERAKGFDLKSLGLMGLGGLIIAAMTKLRDYIEGLELDSSEWFTQLLPDDLLGDGLSLGSTILASLGVASLARTLIFGSPSGKDGKGPRKGGLLRGLRAVLLNQFRSISWVKALTGFKFGAGTTFAGLGIAAAMSKIGFSALPIIFDGIAGYFKAEEWDVSKFSGIVGSALGGTGSGATGALTNAVKYGFLGYTIGSIFPGPGNIIGFLIGSILGGVMGYFGGENIARMMDSIGNEVEVLWEKTLQDPLNPTGRGIRSMGGANYRYERGAMSEGQLMYKGSNAYEDAPFSFLLKENYDVPIKKYYSSMSASDRREIENLTNMTVQQLIDANYYVFAPSQITKDLMYKLKIKKSDLEARRPILGPRSRLGALNQLDPNKEGFERSDNDSSVFDWIFNPYESYMKSDSLLPNTSGSEDRSLFLASDPRSEIWNSSLGRSINYITQDNSTNTNTASGGNNFNFFQSESLTDSMGLKLNYNR
tara:strand:+ start:3117 stop:4982 length:1866 start_codon:yes stop_codon:yes gene_type:complete